MGKESWTLMPICFHNTWTCNRESDNPTGGARLYHTLPDAERMNFFTTVSSWVWTMQSYLFSSPLWYKTWDFASQHGLNCSWCGTELKYSGKTGWHLMWDWNWPSGLWNFIPQWLSLHKIQQTAKDKVLWQSNIWQSDVCKLNTSTVRWGIGWMDKDSRKFSLSFIKRWCSGAVPA